MWRNKSSSAINVQDLAPGMKCSMLIFLLVKDEYGVDASPGLTLVLQETYYKQNKM